MPSYIQHRVLRECTNTCLTAKNYPISSPYSTPGFLLMWYTPTGILRPRLQKEEPTVLSLTYPRKHRNGRTQQLEISYRQSTVGVGCHHAWAVDHPFIILDYIPLKLGSPWKTRADPKKIIRVPFTPPPTIS